MQSIQFMNCLFFIRFFIYLSVLLCKIFQYFIPMEQSQFNTFFPTNKKESVEADSHAELGRVAADYIFARVRILPGGLFLSLPEKGT